MQGYGYHTKSVFSYYSTYTYPMVFGFGFNHFAMVFLLLYPLLHEQRSLWITIYNNVMWIFMQLLSFWEFLFLVIFLGSLIIPYEIRNWNLKLNLLCLWGISKTSSWYHFQVSSGKKQSKQRPWEWGPDLSVYWKSWNYKHWRVKVSPPFPFPF